MPTGAPALRDMRTIVMKSDAQQVDRKPKEPPQPPGHGGDNPGNPKDPGDKGNPNQIVITVVVNGQPTEVRANVNAPLRTVRDKALEATENVGQEPENWELKDEAGTVLDLDKKIGEFGFPKDVTLFLSLKAGQAGE